MFYAHDSEIKGQTNITIASLKRSETEYKGKKIGLNMKIRKSDTDQTNQDISIVI